MNQTAYFFYSHPRRALAAGRERATWPLLALLCALAPLAPGATAKPAEPPGPSSTRTPLVISEIMYKPAPRTDGRNLEYIELFNSSPLAETIGGYRLSGPIDFTFPPALEMPGHTFLVVAHSPADVQTVYGLSTVLGGAGTNYVTNLVGGAAHVMTNVFHSLPGQAEIQLHNDQGALLLSLPYSNETPWPVAADGAGHSLVLARPSYGEENPASWASSDLIGGSPGAFEPVDNEPLRPVVINEFLANTEGSVLDFIELYNHSESQVTLAGAYLTDDPDTAKFRIPSGTKIPAHGFVRFRSDALGFALDPEGETIFLLNPARTRVIDAVRFGGQAKLISTGRYPDGGDAFYPLSDRTPLAPNAPPLAQDLVINEIMANPPSGDADDQFVELFNRGAAPVNLQGWEFTGGIQFQFPDNMSIAAGGYLAVARNATNLAVRYTGALTCANALGNFDGKLNRQRDRVALTRPEEVVIYSPTEKPKTNRFQVVVDEVRYGSPDPSGKWARGGGASLELLDPRADRRSPANWADSAAPANSAWFNIRNTAVLDNGAGPADELQIILSGEGECLLDDVEVISGATGVNLVRNSTFETGFAYWMAEGNHSRSGLETQEGYQSQQSLHVRSSGPGDTYANRILIPLSQPLEPGEVASIRAAGRWLRGSPDVILRLHGSYMEAAARLPISTQIGTPGAPNSHAGLNHGPLISDVTHFPILPDAGQPAVVSARVSDPDGLNLVRLHYRLDPAAAETAVTMVDDGSGGDTVAGDGTFSATIPAQASGTLAAFYVEAADQSSAHTVSRFPCDPTRECLVRFQDPAAGNSFGSYRIWLTAQALADWESRPVLDREPIPATVVYGDSRVIYDAAVRYAADPLDERFDSPVGQPCHYDLLLPGDDLLLGHREARRLVAPGGQPGDDDTLQRGRAADWLARQLGLPYPARRFVNVFVNGTRRGRLMEEVQTTGPEFLREWFPGDADGSLFQLEPWFETGTNAASITNFAWATLNNFTTTKNEKKVARYRWNCRLTSDQDPVLGYEPLFPLIDAAHAADDTAFVLGLQQMTDIEEWLKAFALEHALGNIESFGNLHPHNNAAYLPPGETWMVLPGIRAAVLGSPGSSGPTGDALFQADVMDPAMTRLSMPPVFRRAYWRALAELLDAPLQPAQVESFLDATHTVFQSEGVNAASPATIKDWLQARRGYLNAQLQNIEAPFVLEGPATVTTNRNQLQLTGTAPVAVQSIRINGTESPITWTSETHWLINVFLGSGTNSLVVEGIDASGQAVSGAHATFTAVLTQPVVSPVGHVVINEIMYKPATSGASFVELHNHSTTASFDLSNWRLDGVKFTFPPGTFLPPGGYLVIVGDRDSFVSVYGGQLPVAGVFEGGLNNKGEILSLVQPGPTASDDQVIDQVFYSSSSPWPGEADGMGYSLQLIDPLQDNSRAANWTVDLNTPNPEMNVAPATPGRGNSVRAQLPEFPPLWLNEVESENVQEIVDAAGEHDPWIELFNSGTNAIPLDHYFLSDQLTNLAQWQFPAGATIAPGQFLIVWVDGEPGQATGTEWHTNFRLGNTNAFLALSRLTNGQPQIMDYLKFDSPGPDRSFGSYPDGQAVTREPFLLVTAGASNNAPPRVFLNEWMASNTRTIDDPADGSSDDWIELFNAGYHDIDLSGWFLSDEPTNPFAWQFPRGTIIKAQDFLLVWADAEPEQNAPGRRDRHASFKLSKSGESLALYDPAGALRDSITFSEQRDDVSQGRYPDGAAGIAFLSFPTPRQPNILVAPAPPAEPIVTSAGSIVNATLSLPGVPLYAVSYELGTDAPAGVTLNPVTGQLLWQPMAGQTAVTNTFSVRICDLRPGSVPFTAMVTIVVAPPLKIVRAARTAVNELTLGWQAVPGTTYQLQYRDDLASGSWIQLGTGIPATSDIATIAVPIGTNRHRFFRIIQF